MELCLEYPIRTSIENRKQQTPDQKSAVPTIRDFLSHLYVDTNSSERPTTDKKLLALYRAIDIGA
jgi:hypothetical protein